MKQKKDIRFWLTTFFEEQEQTKHPYKSYQREIENNGCFIVKTETETVKIYTPELAVIFTSKELPARNMDTQKETTLNGWEYLNTYIEAYKEGEQYFETEFKVSPNTLYGANAEQYVRDIHLNFFHIQHTGINEGWVYVKKQYPFILTHKAVKEFGYYSGIVNKVEEQVKKYPRLFATFDKCEHNLPPQQTETKTDKLKVPQIALIHVYEGIQITRGNAGEIAAKYGYRSKNSGEGLFQDYTNYCSTANRKGKPTPCTPKKLKNKIELFESVVNHLSDNNKQRAIDEIQILKTIFENEYQ
jgi:hypothetical protein